MIGVHINSDINEIINEIDKYNDCNIFQLFVDPFYKHNKKYEEFKIKNSNNGNKIVVHASYTINIAQNWNEYSWNARQLIEEINTAEKINAFAIVLHLGKKMKLTIEEAINNMYTFLLYIDSQTRNSTVKILLETSTGQGSEMCYKLEELAQFYRKLSMHSDDKIRNKFGICLDTCHIFSAGYDISNKERISIFLDMFDRMIGLTHIKLIHLNDSKNEIGAKIDRHENIGKGFIGKNALKIIGKIFNSVNVPIILETPDKYLMDDIKIIKE
jgi:deoxyribonuclease-4